MNEGVRVRERKVGRKVGMKERRRGRDKCNM